MLDFYADGQTKSVSVLHQNTTGGWDHAWRDNYFYTSKNLSYAVFQTGSGSAWNNVNKRLFTYDTTQSNFHQQNDHDYMEGTFFPTDDFDHTYRSGNNLLTCTRNLWGGTAFSVDTSKFIYTYDATTHLLVSKTLVQGSSMVNDSLSLYSNFTSAGMPQTEIDQKWNGTAWDNVMRYTYTYNSFNQVTSKLAETWTGSAWVTGPYLLNYYYSPYTPSDVAIAENTTEVNISPNPTGNIFTLRVNLKEAIPFTVCMYDIAGKEVYNTSVPACDKYIRRIPTQNLPAGNYVLKVTCPGGVTAKQVTIAH